MILLDLVSLLTQTSPGAPCPKGRNKKGIIAQDSCLFVFVRAAVNEG